MLGTVAVLVLVPLGTPTATTFDSGEYFPSVFRALIGRPRPQIRKYSAKFNSRYNLAGLTEHRILRSDHE